MSVGLKNLSDVIENRLSTLSCKDFNPKITNNFLKDTLKAKFGPNPPYWSNELHPALKHVSNLISNQSSFFLEALLYDTVQSNDERPLPSALIKITIESKAITIEMGNYNSKNNNFEKFSNIEMISLSRKDLFKDCQPFMTALKNLLELTIDMIYK